MARPREFDADKALKGAMDVFWLHGYEGASLPYLLKGMGITRGSLYKAFTDKKSLFMDVLEHYEKDIIGPAEELLNNHEISDGLQRIEQLFMLIPKAVGGNDYRGCLLCSAAAGPASKDKEIAELVHRLLNKMKSAINIALSQSSRHSDLKLSERDRLADLLITQYVGLRILSRSQAPADTLKRSISSLMQMLTVPNPQA